MTKGRGPDVRLAPPGILVLALLLGGLAAAAPERVTLSERDIRDSTWTAVSQDAKAVLEQSADVTGCKATCRREGMAAPAWTSSACLGKRLDLRFVSNDCERLVVLHQYPDPVPNLRAAPVVHVYDHGELAYPVQAAGMVQSWSAIRPTGRTFYWLHGAMGIPGTSPHYGPRGETVEFETLDDKAQTISLHSTPGEKPASPAPKKKKRKHRS